MMESSSGGAGGGVMAKACQIASGHVATIYSSRKAGCLHRTTSMERRLIAVFNVEIFTAVHTTKAGRDVHQRFQLGASVLGRGAMG